LTLTLTTNEYPIQLLPAYTNLTCSSYNTVQLKVTQLKHKMCNSYMMTTSQSNILTNTFVHSTNFVLCDDLLAVFHWHAE